jgi:hypothetical protein
VVGDHACTERARDRLHRVRDGEHLDSVVREVERPGGEDLPRPGPVELLDALKQNDRDPHAAIVTLARGFGLQDPAMVAGGAELLERDPAFAVLEDALASARSGEGRLVFVSGDAGVGKSALVRSFTARFGGRALVGSCDGLQTPRPLGPFVDIGVRGETPRAVFEALVDELRSSDPTVVVVEDAHWADEATLDAVGLIGRRVQGLRALVVVTFRADELQRTHPLLITLHVWLWYPNPSGLFASTNPLVSPFNEG